MLFKNRKDYNHMIKLLCSGLPLATLNIVEQSSANKTAVRSMSYGMSLCPITLNTKGFLLRPLTLTDIKQSQILFCVDKPYLLYTDLVLYLYQYRLDVDVPVWTLVYLSPPHDVVFYSDC